MAKHRALIPWLLAPATLLASDPLVFELTTEARVRISVQGRVDPIDAFLAVRHDGRRRVLDVHFPAGGGQADRARPLAPYTPDGPTDPACQGRCLGARSEDGRTRYVIDLDDRGRIQAVGVALLEAETATWLDARLTAPAASTSAAPPGPAAGALMVPVAGVEVAGLPASRPELTPDPGPLDVFLSTVWADPRRGGSAGAVAGQVRITLRAGRQPDERLAELEFLPASKAAAASLRASSLARFRRSGVREPQGELWVRQVEDGVFEWLVIDEEGRILAFRHSGREYDLTTRAQRRD